MATPNIEELIAALTQTNQFHESADICTSDVITVLQSQAERIAELDSLAANAIVAAADSQKAYMKLLDENFALRAELAAIEAIAICRRNAQNTSADELEALKGK